MNASIMNLMKWKRSVEKSGFIYVVKSRRQKAFKVGLTTQSVEKRVASLQTGCADKLELIGKFQCNSHLPLIESAIHDFLSHKGLRLQGEWFKETPDSIKYINSLVYWARRDVLNHHHLTDNSTHRDLWRAASKKGVVGLGLTTFKNFLTIRA